MYRPPMSSGTQRLERTRHAASEREDAVMLRQHREHLAAERARERSQIQLPTPGAHRLTRPFAAIWAQVGLRR
jgi:hypothetical protein